MNKLAMFEIGFVATTADATDALYANGRQQCKVFIKILKETLSDGTWRVAALSNNERNSLTVLPYSNQLRPSQAPGWSCDDNANRYDEGLWRGNAAVGLRSAGDNMPAEEFYRYMRFDGRQTPIQPTRFMACIALDDGKQYSTHMDNGDIAFDSSITITPQVPYVLHVSDLAPARQIAYTRTDIELDVDAHYWTLPGGLRVLEEAFNGENGSNSKVVYVYAEWGNINYFQNIAVRRDTSSLTFGEMDPRLPSPYKDLSVPLISGNRLLRVLYYKCSTYIANTGGNYNTLTYWTITDNYGCESRFALRAYVDDRGRTIELVNA